MWKEALIPKTSWRRLVATIPACNRRSGRRMDKSTDTRVRDNSIYRASIVSRGKNADGRSAISCQIS